MSNDNQTETQEGKRQFDKSYRNIFSDKESFIHFLQKYVQLPWAEGIDKDDLTPVDSNFVTKEFGEFESDVIYKHEKKNIFFYILLEQQSTPDFSMPFRLLHYTVLLLAREFRNANPPKKRTPKDYRLPAVVPIVLYNGKEKWTPVRTFKEYTANHGEFGDYLIDFKYILFDLNRYNEDEIMTTYKLLDFVFSMDLQHNSKDKEDFHKKLRKLAALQNELTDNDVRAFLAWIINVIFRGKKPHENFEQEVFATFRKGDVEKMTHAFDGLLDMERNSAVDERMAEVARKMIKHNKPVEEIMEFTDLTRDKIEELRPN